MIHNTQTIALIGLLAVLPLVGNAQCQSKNIIATTPSSQFLDNRNGTVTDNKTGLIWKHCGEGQTWTGASCAGTAARYSWQQALMHVKALNSAGKTDWRVPNVKELVSIIERQCSKHAVNSKIFPNIDTYSIFWTSTPDVSNNRYVWFVNFQYGYAGSYGKDSKYELRLVRGG